LLHFIEEAHRHQYRYLLDQYFRLRKRVFHDQLKWEVRVTGDMELDIYDRMPNVYILSTSPSGQVLGGLRQMPTTGPTLTWEVFSDMVPDRSAIMSPRVWETTRFCVEPELGHLKVRSGTSQVAIELSLGAIDFGIRNGITRHIAVCERSVFELTRSFRIPSEIIGSRVEPNGSEILCVAWEINEATAERMEWARVNLGVA